MSAGSTEGIDEEWRLPFALTLANRHPHLIQPIRYYRGQQPKRGDSHAFAPLTRFLPDTIIDRFERRQWPESNVEPELIAVSERYRVDVAARMRDMWRLNTSIQKVSD